MRIRFGCLFAFLLGVLVADAQQQGKLYGVVSDAITGETLIQASIRMGDGGTVTDFDGRYEWYCLSVSMRSLCSISDMKAKRKE